MFGAYPWLSLLCHRYRGFSSCIWTSRKTTTETKHAHCSIRKSVYITVIVSSSDRIRNIQYFAAFNASSFFQATNVRRFSACFQFFYLISRPIGSFIVFCWSPLLLQLHFFCSSLLVHSVCICLSQKKTFSGLITFNRLYCNRFNILPMLRFFFYKFCLLFHQSLCCWYCNEFAAWLFTYFAAKWIHLFSTSMRFRFKCIGNWRLVLICKIDRCTSLVMKNCAFGLRVPARNS